MGLKRKLKNYFQVMLCEDGTIQDLERKNFVAELKVDGSRCVVERTKEYGFRLYGRRGLEYTKTLVEIAEPLSKIPQLFRLDGEIVYIDDEGHMVFAGCYSDDTEVLTENGWKLFKDISMDERLATLNRETHRLEYQYPSSKTKFWYDGMMIRRFGKHIDLLVTPNHNMWIRLRRTRKNEVEKFGRWKKFKFRKAFNLPKEFYIKRNANWKGEEKKRFILPEYYNEWESGFGKRSYYQPEIKIPMDDWLAFFGIWLAEGSLSSRNKCSVRVYQKKYKNVVRKIMEKMPFELHKFQQDNGLTVFYFNSIQLGNYLSQFGKSYEKYIPKWILDLSSDKLRKLLYSFAVGDGAKRTKHNRKNNKMPFRSISSSSRRLIDNFQELLLKIGYAGQITPQSNPHIGDRQMWKLTINNYNLIPIVKNGESINYSGYVYCFEVPNHLLFVRRNGKPCWCGNSQKRCQISNPKKVRQYRKAYPIGMFVFDIPMLNGIDLKSLAWIQRRQLLENFMSLNTKLYNLETIRLIPISYKPKEMYERAVKEGYEGIVLKKMTSPYVQKRSKFWLKVKARSHTIYVLDNDGKLE